MATVEIDSFINKSKLLLSAGFNASLNLQSNLGEVSITLNCKVGRTSPPLFSPVRPYAASPKHRSPSYLRRQARRKAARNSSDVILDAEEADRTDVLNEVESSPCEDISAVAANAYTTDDVPAEEVDENDRNDISMDKVIDEVIFYTVGEPTEKKEVVEQDIKICLSNVGVTVMNMQTFCDGRGNFDQSRVKITPVNMKSILGRHLGVKNCAVMECKPTPSFSKL